MKALKQICIAFLIMIVAVSSVTAQTENKDLPPEKELRSFIDGIDASDNYLSYITELSQTEHPTWKWDLWSDRVSFYYCDSGSSKGYGSIYLDSTGNEVAQSCSGSCKLVKSYIGEAEPINKDVVKLEADVDESEIEDEEDNTVGTETRTTYADLLKFLEKDNTNEKGFGSSKECSIHLISKLPDDFKDESKLVKAYFKKDSNGKYTIRHCVGIETSDEGLVYIDSYSGKTGSGIDKRVTVLEVGQRWQAESADGTCPYDETGRYNRGKVLKIKIVDGY